MPDIHHSLFVNASPAKIFDAMTSVNGLDSWCTLKSQGKPLLNETYIFYFGSQFDWRSQVIHVVANKELTWKMTEAMEDWLGTEVGFTLTAENSGTHVRFF